MKVTRTFHPSVLVFYEYDKREIFKYSLISIIKSKKKEYIEMETIG